MMNRCAWLNGVVQLLFAAPSVVGLLRERSFVLTVRPDSGSGSENSFFTLSKAFEVEYGCELGSIEKIMLGRQGKCDSFAIVKTYSAEAGGDVEAASLKMFESTLNVDFTKGDSSFFMNITDGSDNYSVSNSTNPLHMYDTFKCTIQVLSLIQSPDLGEATPNDGNPDIRKIPSADANSLEQGTRALADTVGTDVTNPSSAPAVAASISDVSFLVGERSDPACIRQLVIRVLNLQATFKRRSQSAGRLLMEDLALSIVGVSIGSIMLLSIIVVVASKELVDRRLRSQKKGSKSMRNIKASIKKQQDSDADSDSD